MLWFILVCVGNLIGYFVAWLIIGHEPMFGSCERCRRHG
jgi:hypothetical protein